MPLSNDRQVASAAVRFGKVFKAKVRVDVSSAGLLASGAVVCGIVLSSAVFAMLRRRGGSALLPPD